MRGWGAWGHVAKRSTRTVECGSSRGLARYTAPHKFAQCNNPTLLCSLTDGLRWAHLPSLAWRSRGQNVAEHGLLNHLSSDGFDYWSNRLFRFAQRSRTRVIHRSFGSRRKSPRKPSMLFLVGLVTGLKPSLPVRQPRPSSRGMGIWRARQGLGDVGKAVG